MEIFQILSIIIIILTFILSIAVFFVAKKKQQEIKKTGKYPEGHLMGTGIALGIPFGVAMGVIMDNIALGPAIGVAVGVAIGRVFEAKIKKGISPLTEEEKKLRRWTMIFLTIILILAIISFFTMFFLRK